MIAVVDKSVLTLADEKTARTLPTHFLLTSDVKKTEELEYADFLLGPHPKASQALDLLLGTHGWRRFAQPAGAVAPDCSNQAAARDRYCRRPRACRCGRAWAPIHPAPGLVAQQLAGDQAGRHRGRPWPSRLPGHERSGPKGTPAVPGASCLVEDTVCRGRDRSGAAKPGCAYLAAVERCKPTSVVSSRCARRPCPWWRPCWSWCWRPRSSST